MEEKEDCLLFIDDSNVWIEAQKFAVYGNPRMPKFADGDRDPRLRIDIGKLVNTLCRGRNQRKSNIYGSRPPPNDLVWEQYEKWNFETKIYDRGANGKEKEVDNSMAVDLSGEAVELHVSAKYNADAKRRKDRTVFVVITGDRDLLPAVKKVLHHGFPVELWGWKLGIARDYLRERNDNGLLSVKFLDDIFTNISFTNCRSTRNTKLDPAQTIVLCDPDCSRGESWNEYSVAQTLLQTGRLFYTTRSKTGTEIFAGFPKVNNIDTIIHKARTLFGGQVEVLSWPIYASRFNKDDSDMIETSNMFRPLAGGDERSSSRTTTDEVERPSRREPEPENSRKESPEVESHIGDTEDEEGWQQVKSRTDLQKAHGRNLRRPQPCSSGQHCRSKGDCGYKHTQKEMNRFHESPNQDFTVWKTRKCAKPWCREGERCAFAHSKEEAWCLSCKSQGHFTDECKTMGG